MVGFKQESSKQRVILGLSLVLNVVLVLTLVWIMGVRQMTALEKEVMEIKLRTIDWVEIYYEAQAIMEQRTN